MITPCSADSTNSSISSDKVEFAKYCYFYPHDYKGCEFKYLMFLKELDLPYH